MTDHDTRLAGRLRELINGYQVTQAMSVATGLGVPDLLAGGPRSAEDLAEAAGADPAALYRLLRALAALGLLAERDDGPARTFALTELGGLLRSDAPGSLAGWAAFVSRPYYWAACAPASRRSRRSTGRASGRGAGGTRQRAGSSTGR
jgi:DNA-binding transcriptional ArsR family regulator